MTQPDHLSPRRFFPALLAGLGSGSTLLALADKWIGLLHSPYLFASVAYVSLFGLVAWAVRCGVPVRGRRLYSGRYAAFLLLVLLTAAYVFALKATRDPTPILVQQRLRQADRLLESGSKDDALLIYREAYRTDPHSFPVLMRMGAISYRNQDYERARRYYTEAVSLAPEESRGRALLDLGQTVWKLGQPEAAIRLYEDAGRAGMARREPVEWHYRLGWACFDARDYRAAIDHYRAVVDAGREYVAASLYNIACAQAQEAGETVDPAERWKWIGTAVESLRQAWAATSAPDEIRSLRRGLFGTPAEQDPDLAILRPTPEFRALTRELAGEPSGEPAATARQ